MLGTHFLNHAELHVTAAAYSARQGLLLVCDGRSLRLYNGAQCLCTAQLPTTVHGALIRWLHYNLRADHFIAVYGSHEAHVVDIDLTMHEAGCVDTEQLSILASAWAHARQELLTAGGNGTLRFFQLQRKVRTFVWPLSTRKLIVRLRLVSSARSYAYGSEVTFAACATHDDMLVVLLDAPRLCAFSCRPSTSRKRI
jgi:hypothetical protein